MAIHMSAIQQWKRSLKRREINRKNKSTLRTQVRSLREAIKNNDKDQAQEMLPITFSLIDQSIKKGTIHKNTGNRYKSRLSKRVNLITSAPSE